MLRSLLCMLAVASAVTPNAAAIRRALEARYQHAATLKAVFYERFSDGKGGGQAESGVVYFSKPGRMRWEYESPEKKLFLVDGTNVWFYVPADHTASRAKMKESSDWRTPIALLAGKADLSKLCRSLEVVDPSAPGTKPEEKPLTPGDTVLRCTPREKSDDLGESITDALLETDPEAHLVRVVIREPGNLETEYRFGNWQENIPVPEVKFHFDPPPGVEIVDEEKLAGEIR
ncbi:MAG TPA: outer membrane lipoprotein carrier protein LolA [Candidatus Limnocylindrales bacterium]|nr:outer membrane lipoprotein carrier protein LolA [Candidatus Limnocylindrales bacterium]